MFVRIEQFAIKSGAEEKGRLLLRDHAAFLAAAPGCGRAYVAAPVHGPSHIVYSEWRAENDLERLEATLRMNPAASGAFFGLMAIVQTPPHVARFEVLP
ncbi:MAG: hypothetical protein E6K10_03780 [Methanobacteriota archaeon]|nr:MAG: hypothetical protein E6K10_03780 [Euryarchaeota archaeon]